MNGFASVVVVGNIVRNPALKYSPDGIPIAEFGIAVNEKWTKNGEKKESVSYFDVTFFGKTAETVGQWLVKGKPVAVEGKLQQRRWETDSGDKRSKVEIIGNRFHFLPDGKGPQGEGQPEAESQQE